MTPRRLVATLLSALLAAQLALLLTGCRPSQPLDIGSDTPALDVVYGRPSPSTATTPTSRPPTSSAPTTPTTPTEAAQPTEAR